MMISLDVNKINCKYFSRGAQLELFKEEYLNLLPPEEILFPKHIKNGDSVLDLGCGAGRTTSYIKKMTDKVIGTDISAIMIATAKEKHPDIEFQIMDASKLDYPDNCFDVVVFSYNGLCYLYPEEKRNASIIEINRVLKKNGKIIFSSFNRYPPLTLSSIVNMIVTKILMGFKSKYTIHVTRHGITINYETSPKDETDLFSGMNFELHEMVPMVETVGFMRYRPNIATYYVFSKS
jgi:ubiquinone/menaquinone biosynthesis C-methylase UbiE